MSWKAGTASTVITPTEPTWLAGFAVRKEPAKGTISNLRARALALEATDGKRLLIVSLDLIAVGALVRTGLSELRKKHGLDEDSIILGASHTHYGPEVRPDKVTFFRIPESYISPIYRTAKRVRDAIAAIADAAFSDLREAQLFVRHSTATFAHNRRRTGLKGGAPSPEDVLDQDVPILDVIDTATGRRRAVVFGYACHNTTIPPEDCRYCADWAGFAAEQIELDNPGATALFIAGCGADQNPEPRGSVELSRQYGKELADAVARALATPGHMIESAIHAASEKVPLALAPLTRDDLNQMLARSDDPPQQVKARFLLDALEKGETLITSYPAPLQAIRLGDQLLMIVMSGEPVVDWSHKFRKQFASVAPQIWVAGYCNDMQGYIPTRRIQQEGGYEGGRATLWSWVPAPWAEDVEDRITAAVTRLVDRVS